MTFHPMLKRPECQITHYTVYVRAREKIPCACVMQKLIMQHVNEPVKIPPPFSSTCKLNPCMTKEFQLHPDVTVAFGALVF